MSKDPITRFTLLVLFQAQQDRATKLVINTTNRGRLSYQVDGTWYDMSPPPSHIFRGAVAELERLAGLREETFPKEGIIDMAYSGIRLRWGLQMTSAEAECVLTPLTQ